MKRHISIFALLLSAVFAVGSVGGLRAGTYEHVYARFVSTGDNWNANDTTHITPTSMTLYDNSQQKPVIFTALPPDGYQVTRWLWSDSFNAYLKESDMSEITGSKISDDKKTCTLAYSGDGSRALGVRFDYMPLTVTFKPNGGSGTMSPIADNTNIDSSFSLTANAYEKTGYSFDGWTNDLSKSFTDKASVKGSDFWDKTTAKFHAELSARWTANTYTVTFDGNGGGTPSPTSKTVTYDSTYGDLATCEREGWQFDGWYTATDGGSKIDSGTKVAITANQALYAHWTQKFKVTFYESTLFETSKVLKEEWVLAGGNATPPAHPVHDGYTSDGWSETYTNVRANEDVWAKYTANQYSVKFHANDGSGRTSTQPFLYGQEKNLLLDPLPRKGYVLEGWTREKTSSTVDYKPGALVSNLATGGTVDLYALWKPISYTVTFVANGGEGEMDPVSLAYDMPFTVPECGFTKTGCEFRSWSATVGGVATNFEAGAVVSNLTSEVDATVTFRAEWTGYYTVAFDANGGTGTMTNLTYAWDVEYQLPSNAFAKAGYRFYGWATNRADAVSLKTPIFTNEASVVNLAAAGETCTLFAEWQTNTYTVGFLPGGARGTMEDQSFVYDQPQTLNPCTFVRGDPELWSFVGWTNSVGYLYEPGETVSNLTAEPNGRVELTAVWSSTIGPLSEAMGCDNLKWESESWTVCDSEGYDGPPCVQQIDGYYEAMYAHYATNGVLTFKFKLTTENDYIDVVLGKGRSGDSSTNSWTFAYEEGVEWQEANIRIHVLEAQLQPAYIRIYHRNDWESGTAYIDQMTWTPDGSEPKYVDVDSEVTEFSMADGKLVFAFNATNDETSAYHLLGTNDLVAPMPWPMVYEIGKPFGSFSFEISVKDDEPKMFYRIRALK